MLTVDLNGPHDIAERRLVSAVFVLRRDRDHVEQLTVLRLRSNHRNNLRLPSGSVHVSERRRKSVSAGEGCALQTTALAEIWIALRQAINELTSGLLEVTSLHLRHT